MLWEYIEKKASCSLSSELEKMSNNFFFLSTHNDSFHSTVTGASSYKYFCPITGKQYLRGRNQLNENLSLAK